METTLAEELRAETAAVRLSHSSFGRSKALDASQKQEAADTFNARADALATSKRLLSSKHPAIKKVNGIRLDAIKYWNAVTIPYPERGIRLIQKGRVERFNERMIDFRADLLEAANEMQADRYNIMELERERLVDLFDESNYPADFSAEFALDWDYPNVDPPAYLMKLNPELYQREKDRMQRKFELAIEAAEEAYMSTFAELVGHLVEKLSVQPGTEGQKMVSGSAINNLHKFFDSFRDFSVRSNDQLDALVEDAKRAISGVEAKRIRESGDLRNQLSEKLGKVMEAVEPMLTTKPKRMIRFTDEV